MIYTYKPKTMRAGGIILPALIVFGLLFEMLVYGF